jgi:hypothetical protein
VFHINEKQMGSTFFGVAIAAGEARSAAPQQTDTDRGTGGRASGCD